MSSIDDFISFHDPPVTSVRPIEPLNTVSPVKRAFSPDESPDKSMLHEPLVCPGVSYTFAPSLPRPVSVLISVNSKPKERSRPLSTEQLEVEEDKSGLSSGLI